MNHAPIPGKKGPNVDAGQIRTFLSATLDPAVGCMEIMGKVSCDLLEDVGEPCFGDRAVGCSSDHQKMMTCSSGKWCPTTIRR